MIMVRFSKTKRPKDWSLIGFRNIKFLILLALFACAPEAPEKSVDVPDWAIPEDKMVNVLLDVHILEGARIGTKVLGDSLPVKSHYDHLWNKHGITRELYDSSFRFYSRNSERMDKMYEEVLVRLTKMSSNVAPPPETEEEED